MADGQKVKIGILLPTRGVLRWRQGAPEFGPILDLAERSEALGFDSGFVGDSITARTRLEALSVWPRAAPSTASATT